MGLVDVKGIVSGWSRATCMYACRNCSRRRTNPEADCGEPAKALTGDYALAVATCKEDRQASKLKILVATDVTDNYVLIVGAPESDFDRSLETIDTVWGSFSMFSGGASGGS